MTTTPLTRRSMMVGACAAGCAALAGCATYGGPQFPATSAPPQAGAPAQAAPTQGSAAPQAPAQGSPGQGGGAALARTADIPVGTGKIFGAEQVVVTQPSAGVWKAFDTTCTHQGCTVSSVSSGSIECPCHGSMFSITDGAPTAGPAKKPLAARKVTVANGSITLA
ncbi:hypothetical protein GCM10009836_08600 [Pseudonocardia ailaonensis]|uniref:Cytochrome bc1 complex Rieske iron-sulfur subunit n=1 Tax=Pseudonocardia ailaonensis TaxID=367279 RepID=A0ABN2MMW5_9PSEU